MMTRTNLIIGVLIAALAQSGVLGWMVYDRISLLKNGREIVLPVIPVDPRSIFRGDYVRLNYPISQVASNLLSGDLPHGTMPVYVTLKKNAAGDWTPEAVKLYFAPAQDDDHIVLKARTITRNWRRGRVGRQLHLRYGIESYFVEEGRGLELEKLVGSKKLAILVAVDQGGQAAIKGLMVDGVLQYKESLL